MHGTPKRYRILPLLGNSRRTAREEVLHLLRKIGKWWRAEKNNGKHKAYRKRKKIICVPPPARGNQEPQSEQFLPCFARSRQRSQSACSNPNASILSLFRHLSFVNIRKCDTWRKHHAPMPYRWVIGSVEKIRRNFKTSRASLRSRAFENMRVRISVYHHRADDKIKALRNIPSHLNKCGGTVKWVERKALTKVCWRVLSLVRKVERTLSNKQRRPWVRRSLCRWAPVLPWSMPVLIELWPERHCF